jgi:amidohydrolase
MHASMSAADLIDQFRPDLNGKYAEFYREFHRIPELSLGEKGTSEMIAKILSHNCKGINIHKSVGGHGVVGVLENGPGKTVLFRADIDALPLEEKTGLPYASTARMVDVVDGVEKPVMHACGHDMHITSQLAAGHLLYDMRESWSGTLVLLFQPNEERGAGAQAMVDDGLYDPQRFAVPKPDIILGCHVMPMRAGKLNTRKGVFGSAADSYQVTLYGRGGHGSRPQMTVDPVVLASSTVMRLQTIVSRETHPQEACVVTVGSLQAGTVENIISDKAVLKINTRTFSAESRQRVKSAIERIVKAESEASGSPKPPLIEPISNFPVLYNDEAATEAVSTAMAAYFGADFSPEGPISMGSEDFNNLAVDGIPCVFWNYGGIDPAYYDEMEANGTLDQIPGIRDPLTEVISDTNMMQEIIVHISLPRLCLRSKLLLMRMRLQPLPFSRLDDSTNTH